jgi:hypothetical protein
MDDPIRPELALAEALRMTAAPPAAWIEAAAMLPATLGELSEIERLVARPDFRKAFGADPERALSQFGLQASPPVISALREHLARR